MLKGESEKDQEERMRERRAKKEKRHAKKVREENELLERAAYEAHSGEPQGEGVVECGRKRRE